MVERKLFKTKLCILYQRGHCPRHNCSFAHGNAELRHFVSSHNGERDYRGGDLRDKLDKRISPQRRYSSERDARGQHAFHGSGPFGSPERNCDTKRRKKQHPNGPNEFSASFKTMDGAEARFDERKSASSELKEVQSNLKMLDHRKSQLKILLEEKVEEGDSLSSIIQELEAQLSKEREESKRVASKTKKIIKAQKRHVWLQGELKRSQARFQKLCDQLLSGTITTGGNGEDSNINIVSDGEAKTNQRAIRPRNLHINYSSTDLVTGGGHEDDTFRLGRLSHLSEFNNNVEPDKADYRSDGHWSLENEVKQKRGKSAYTGIGSADKLRGAGPGPGLLLPSTSMAAHASDELAEVELEENIEVVDNVCTGMDKGETTYNKSRRVPFILPPPPVPQNAYRQHQGEDETVDVEGVEEMVDVDTV